MTVFKLGLVIEIAICSPSEKTKHILFAEDLVGNLTKICDLLLIDGYEYCSIVLQ
jgi:hypothetical protein